MKRLLTYLMVCLLVLALGSPAYSIDKKEKPKKKTDQQQKTQSTDTAKPADKNPKKYDNFVDSNNNGIDDRRENLKPKDTTQTVPKPPKR